MRRDRSYRLFLFFLGFFAAVFQPRLLHLGHFTGRETLGAHLCPHLLHLTVFANFGTRNRIFSISIK